MSELKLRPLKTRVFPQPARPRRQSGWRAPQRRPPLEAHIILSGKELKCFALSMIRKCSFYKVYHEILLHEWLPPLGSEDLAERPRARKRRPLGTVQTGHYTGSTTKGQDTFCA